MDQALHDRCRSEPGVTPRTVILDCDPGHDDALALLLALARPEVRLLAVTTVSGNAPLEQTTRNALRVLTLLGRTDVPVAAGADRPLDGVLRIAPEVHGASGLDGADLPEPAAEAVDASALELASAFLEAEDAVTIVATGPLTNVAGLLSARPDLLPRIEAIVLMGGAIGEGNWTASAEFNIWADPQAAAAVMTCGRPLAMMPLEVTHQARLSTADMAAMEALGNRTGLIFADLMRYFARVHAEWYGWDGPPIHDAVAVAHVLGGGLITTRRYPVSVEVEGRHTRGRTVVDTRPFSSAEATVDVGVSIDREAFVRMLLQAIAVFP
ncbi:MAG: nucleoside hydrolase [Chloroflexi bacterium]|nr:nucleoside hydrolase [Chloroflexota bacterium]MBA3852694.1 nucleoside hydrolase [Chloroflexota bacterium]